jgi:DNA-binding transcriptional regulator LsrR (DeoR family)
VADLVGVSRVHVTRLLAEARARKIVEITVHASTPVFGAEEAALIERYGLISAAVAPTHADVDRQAEMLGTAMEHILEYILCRSQTVAVGISGTLAGALSSLSGGDHPIRFVPIGGGRPGMAWGNDAFENAQRLAQLYGGTSLNLPAPLQATSAEAAEVLGRDPGIREVLAVGRQADALVAGLGTATAGMLMDQMSVAEQAELLQLGAVGDCAARYFDKNCQQVHGMYDARVVGLSLDELKAIPLRLVVVSGRHKLGVLRTALTHNLVNLLVIDVTTAHALLET